MKCCATVNAAALCHKARIEQFMTCRPISCLAQPRDEVVHSRCRCGRQQSLAVCGDRSQHSRPVSLVEELSQDELATRRDHGIDNVAPLLVFSWHVARWTREQPEVVEWCLAEYLIKRMAADRQAGGVSERGKGRCL